VSRRVTPLPLELFLYHRWNFPPLSAELFLYHRQNCSSTTSELFLHYCQNFSLYHLCRTTVHYTHLFYNLSCPELADKNSSVSICQEKNTILLGGQENHHHLTTHHHPLPPTPPIE
jgi:hypothetical protein